ncbi:MAG: hypothetical protein CMO34_04340 [Verrucomicrobia bacterium]|nr:hypothetical protein [Verrucomicrobiota bacterium]|tara:strand:+ start:753 stop:1481 length:729 start_codon:yes stop_codon:yes gene_type:complete
MNKWTVFGVFLICILAVKVLVAQKAVTTFGLQFKPIINTDIANNRPQFQEVGNVSFTISPKGGYSFGMLVRKGITKQFSIETSINVTQRNYNLKIDYDLINFKGNSDFRYNAYEIPVLGLIYAQLGERSYLNTAFGLSLNFLPSDWNTFGDYFEHLSVRKSWIMPSILANFGFEYRTYDKGYWYIGFSFLRPFNYITTAIVQYKGPLEQGEITAFNILGNYLTLDLRYFFNEPPENRKSKRR